MKKLIPVMRVNYTLFDILRAFFISNKNVQYRERLCNQISKYFGVGEVILTSSGRNAIYLLLKSLKQKKVIIPSYTCGVVVEAAMLAQKDIIYAHVNPKTLNADFNDVEIDADCIVIATHQYGNPCPIIAIVDRCKSVGALVIEDCAGSLGTCVNGKLTGTFGDYGVFSFSASKTFQSPTKGGFVIACNGADLTAVKEYSKLYADNLKDKFKTLIKSIGFCLNNNVFFCRLITIARRGGESVSSYTDDPSYSRGFYEWQAFVVSKQFDRIDGVLNNRIKMAKEYKEAIELNGIQTFDFDEEAVQIRFPVLLKNKEKVRAAAVKYGIQLGGGYEKVYCPDNSDFDNEHTIIRDIAYLPFGNAYNKKEIDKVIHFMAEIKQ